MHRQDRRLECARFYRIDRPAPWIPTTSPERGAGAGAHRTGRHQPPRQHRRECPRHEDHGPVDPGPVAPSVSRPPKPPPRRRRRPPHPRDRCATLAEAVAGCTSCSARRARTPHRLAGRQHARRRGDDAATPDRSRWFSGVSSPGSRIPNSRPASARSTFRPVPSSARSISPRRSRSAPTRSASRTTRRRRPHAVRDGPARCPVRADEPRRAACALPAGDGTGRLLRSGAALLPNAACSACSQGGTAPQRGPVPARLPGGHRSRRAHAARLLSAGAGILKRRGRACRDRPPRTGRARCVRGYGRFRRRPRVQPRVRPPHQPVRSPPCRCRS